MTFTELVEDTRPEPRPETETNLQIVERWALLQAKVNEDLKEIDALETEMWIRGIEL